MKTTTIQGPVVKVSADFRMARYGEWVFQNGALVFIRACEERIAGRWEGFVSMARQAA
jgi:hypothetical protein